jgi:hypothetical protein
MTIFYLYAASNRSLADSSEAHLHCMKVVSPKKNMVNGGGRGSEGFFGREFKGAGPRVGVASEASCGNLMAMVNAVFVMPMIM